MKIVHELKYIRAECTLAMPQVFLPCYWCILHFSGNTLHQKLFSKLWEMKIRMIPVNALRLHKAMLSTCLHFLDNHDYFFTLPKLSIFRMQHFMMDFAIHTSIVNFNLLWFSSFPNWPIGFPCTKLITFFFFFC